MTFVSRRTALVAGGACAIGVLGCVIGLLLDPAAFCRAWLCSYVFWLGLPLAGVTLVLVHDTTGGDWMGSARPALNAAIATMPLASLAGIPAFIGLGSLYSWVHPSPGLGNVFYLNPTAFFVRYVAYIVLWNLLAAYALFGPRGGRFPIAPALSWISGLGLVVLALSTSFAAIDWILSLEPKFWSSIFPYAQTASWFNTGFAIVVLMVAAFGWPSDERRAHMTDLAQILLATTIFWAYVEFIQFLIIWEENLKTEIPWYLTRIHSVWASAIYVGAALGFVVPFLVLLWAPSKRNRLVLATICVLIVISRIANTWQLVLPEFSPGPPFWLNVAALLALGGAIAFPFAWGLRHIFADSSAGAPVWMADHG